VPSHEEVLNIVKEQARKILAAKQPNEEQMANV
jgi:hypothetical protein